MTDHVFIDGEDVLAAIMDHPRCPHCNSIPGVVIPHPPLREDEDEWMVVTTHQGECATRSLQPPLRLLTDGVEHQS